MVAKTSAVLSKEFLGSIKMRWLAGMLSALVCCGCSSAQVELVGDEDEARTLLVTALDAWKAGKKPDTLKEATPALIVGDDDWRSGKALKEYQIHGTPHEAGGHWRVNAVLTVADGQDESQKSVYYAVTMEPAITIVRADDGGN